MKDGFVVFFIFGMQARFHEKANSKKHFQNFSNLKSNETL